MKTLTRRTVLKGAATGLAVAAAPGLAAARPQAKQPNVILVMTDDQGYGDLGCHGNKVIRTPHLDRLHGRSVRFTQFHVSPTCSPTRASLMTGRYCNATGVWHTVMGRSLLRADEVTVADAFKAGGYRTGLFGKWHLGDNYPFRPQDRGFDEVLAHGGGGVGQIPDYWRNLYNDDTYFRNGKPEKFKGYCTDIWFTEAIKFMGACAAKEQPFFCYLSTNAPHSPFICPKPYWQAYQTAEGKNKPGVPHAAFYGMITNIDDNMGRLMTFLRERGLEENTILVFMTDNGSTCRGYPADMRGRKGSEYDGGHRVPFFVRWPGGGINGGKDIDRLAAHIDVLPTLLDLCGLTRPDGPPVHGTSLVPLLKGEGKGWPKRTLVVDSQRVENPIKWRKSAVMTDRWRLVNGRELYDIQADPGQKTDVAAANAAVVATLRKTYEKWWADTSTRFDEYCPIVLGSAHENPTRLDCMDWHVAKGLPPWNQGQIRRGPAANGFWAVDVKRDGTYEFDLRRWPKEHGGAVEANTARIKIGQIERTADVPAGAKAATFSLKLKAGPATLQTWLTNSKLTRGAYYVYVRRVAENA